MLKIPENRDWWCGTVGEVVTGNAQIPYQRYRSSLGCFASDPAPCSGRWPKWLAPVTSLGSSERIPGFWLRLGPALALEAIWKVN